MFLILQGMVKNDQEFRVLNKVFASGQAIRAASNAVLHPTVHGSDRAGRKNILYADSPQAAGYRPRRMNENLEKCGEIA